MIHDRISQGEAAVFLDPTGRRGRFVQRIGYAASAGCIAYMGLVGINLAGGPINAPLLPQAAEVRSGIERLLGAPGRPSGAATHSRPRPRRADPHPGAAPGGVPPVGSWWPAVPVPSPSSTRHATASPTPRRTTSRTASVSPRPTATVSPSGSLVTPSASGTAAPTVSPSVLPSLAPIG